MKLFIFTVLSILLSISHSYAASEAGLAAGASSDSSQELNGPAKTVRYWKDIHDESIAVNTADTNSSEFNLTIIN